MKVNKIEIFDCNVSSVDASLGYFNPVLVRVHTDTGISGLGEAGISYGTGSHAAVGMVRDLAQLLLGCDPMQNEGIWEHFFRGSFWAMSTGPIVYAGISALDTALWDIRGKILQAPVHQLLGGKTNSRLRAYAGQIQFGWGPVQTALFAPEDYAEAAKSAAGEGFDCVKVDPIVFYDGDKNAMTTPKASYYGLLSRKDINMATARLRAVREALGSDADIILETHSLMGVNAAIQLGRAAEPFDILYYEEPIAPMHVENMALVARNVNIPLASGERIYSRWGYRPFFEQQALGVIQPDICTCGGITETKKICDMAETYDTAVQIHVCGSPVTTAAALQVEAVIPNFIIHEHNTVARKKAMTDMCVHDYQPVDGAFSVPDLPGLGNELNDAYMARYLAHTVC